MPKYTEDELERLVEEGEAQRNEDGSITWSVDNSLDKKPGTWLVRPPQAAPLITEETGQEMALARKEKRRQALEEGFAIGVTNALRDRLGKDAVEHPLTTDEALVALISVLSEAAMNPERKDFARIQQMLIEALEAMPRKKVEIDQRTQTIDMSKAQINVLKESEIAQRLINGRNG